MLHGKFLSVPSIRSKISANFSRELLVLSPTSRLVTVGSGVFASILMMLSATCVGKSSILLQ